MEPGFPLILFHNIDEQNIFFLPKTEIGTEAQPNWENQLFFLHCIDCLILPCFSCLIYAIDCSDKF